VLRECHRVLKSGGLLSGYTIHTPLGLSEADLDRASDLGPSLVGGWEDPATEAQRAGFGVVQKLDATAGFRESSLAWAAGLKATEEVLREELGVEEVEHQVERNGCILAGIEAGLLRRSFWVFERPM
jgi:hypothetical protein